MSDQKIRTDNSTIILPVFLFIYLLFLILKFFLGKLLIFQSMSKCLCLSQQNEALLLYTMAFRPIK